MGAAGDLRHHPAVAGVQVDLARHHRRHDRARPGDHRRGRLVAGRLDPEDGHVGTDHADLAGSKPEVTQRRRQAGLEARQASLHLVGLEVVSPHDQRVLRDVGVVVGADAPGREAEAVVQRLRRVVRHAHLEGHLVDAAGAAVVEERQQEPGRDLLAPAIGIDGDVRHVRLVTRCT